MNFTLYLYLLLASACCGVAVSLSVNNSQHLIVLSHGLMGTEKDLDYLASRLRACGCEVLQSSSNRLTKSTQGVERGARRLIEEINKAAAEKPHLTHVSFVGNSLGGVYARMAAKIYAEEQGKRKLEYLKFTTIATPHLSVASHLYLEEEFGFKLPFALKRVVSKVMQQTGRELFMMDGSDLLHTMACDDAFLAPLRAFKERRLYANLREDFMVPLGTAALLSDEEVRELRSKHEHSSGIVKVIESTGREGGQCGEFSSASDDTVAKMRDSLNSVSWDKHIVNFPQSFPFLPLAHNKIAALRKTPEWFFTHVLGTKQGEHVMDHLAKWLSES